MVFSDLKFIYIFLPVFFSIYYLVPRKWKNLIIVIGSIVFYAIGSIDNPEHIIIFLMCVALDYNIGEVMEDNKEYKKPLLVLSVVYHVAVLAIFKYGNFVLGELNKYYLEQSLIVNVVQPIGISFYTFQGMAYIIDVYRGKIKAERNFVRYATFIVMFEQLIAGPIVTYDKISSELKKRRISINSSLRGFGIFVFGLGLKVLLANPIGKLWIQIDSIGFDSISSMLAWMGAAAFSFQIYFDFFGYSLMAIGLGKMLGFHIPLNFKHPYTSRSMTEFWRRWHITLGAWFREYVYIPLGGNRKGTLCTIRNLLVVWLLTGIWHGAGYNFLIWGLMLFVIMFLEKFVYGDILKKYPILGRVYMIVLIPISWSVFAIEDIGNMKLFFGKLFPVFATQSDVVFKGDYIKYWHMYWPFFIAAILFSTRIPYRLLKKISNKKIKWAIVIIVLAGSTYCLYLGYNDPFLYFRF